MPKTSAVEVNASLAEDVGAGGACPSGQVRICLESYCFCEPGDRTRRKDDPDGEGPDEPGMCKAYSLKARWEGDWGLASEVFELTDGGKKLNCLEKILEQGVNTCRRVAREYERQYPDGKNTDFFDDCLVGGYLLHSPFQVRMFDLGSRQAPLSPVKTYGCQPPLNPLTAFRQLLNPLDYLNIFRTGAEFAARESTGQTCSAYYGGDFLFDSSCNAVDTVPKDLAACDAGKILWRLSPISLLLDGATDLREEASVVPFPLNPDKNGMWYVWHASNVAPLLVYDPEHRGVVHSATQLFGPWTFGGKKLAMQGEASQISPTWENGYEALGSLDSNGDKIVSGEELVPLALWFDGNRNGLSEDGEVKRLTDTGITKLFYSISRRDERTGNLYAQVGFERMIDGKVSFGASVDWYGVEGQSKQDVLSKLLASGSLTTQNNTNENNSETRTAIEPSAAKQTTTGELRGLWRWKANDIDLLKQTNLLPDGYFQFTSTEGGELLGYVLTETAFLPDYKLNSSVSIRTIQGTIKHSKSVDSSTAIQFSLADQNGAHVENTAQLSANGTRLNGITTARVKSGATWVRIEYSWVAERVEG